MVTPLLDPHGQELLQQYRDNLPIYRRIEQIASETITQTLKKQGFHINAIEHRIKEEASLAGKLELKGGKYQHITDITDILGLRIITFYTDDVDKVAAIVKGIFDVDWAESVDKRKLLQLNSFGYSSLHYICRLPKTLVNDPAIPQLNEYRFEIQMRTALQHVWASIEHEIGYKLGVKMPIEHRRQFNRLAGMLELIDDEFSRLRWMLTDYRRQLQALVASGQLDEVPLDAESFRNYLELKPFDRLNQRIAASNQAEIFPTSLMPYLCIMEYFHMETLGDVQRFIDENAEDAYQLAISQLAFTDIDILSENIGAQNLCVVHSLKQGQGREGIQTILDMLNGKQNTNGNIADTLMEQAATLPFMKS